MVHAKKERKQLDTLHAKSAFWLSLGFWIPLFNIGLSIVSIILAASALKKISQEPEIYGGFKYAIIALVLCITSLVLSLVGGILFFISKKFCIA